MNKRALHHMLVVIRQVKLWQLLVLLMALTAWSALMLRQNNLNMITLRNLVQQADEQGGDASGALTTLGTYVTTHMNTSIGPSGLYLQHGYQRAYLQAIDHAKQAGGSTGRVYQQVDDDCQKAYDRITAFEAHVQCVVDRVAAQTSSQSPVVAISVPLADLYRYDFLSPVWSPDVAGFTVLVTVFLLVLIASRMVLAGALVLLLRSRR